MSTSGSLISNLQFSGEYLDSESGLLYLRARYYDPGTAQFLTQDPAVATTREPYAYVEGNPLNASDPSGMDDYANDPLWSQGGSGEFWLTLCHPPGSPWIYYNVASRNCWKRRVAGPAVDGMLGGMSQ